MTWALLSSVFLGALVSGWHCALMCGGLAAGVERVRPLLPRAALVSAQMTMHCGRVAMYVALGALAGARGQLFWRQDWLPVQRGLFGLAGGIIVLQALWIARGSRTTNSRFGHWFAAKSAAMWQSLVGWMRKRGGAGAGSGLASRFLIGCVWGLVPCGLIYGVLPIAMLAGDAVSGAMVMGAFGLGTLPNLMLISRLSAQLAQWGHRPWTRWVAAGVMGVTGVFVLYRAATLSDALLRGGLCLT